jgi:hypothetical protein
MPEQVSVLILTVDGQTRIDRRGEETLTRLDALAIASNLIRQSPFGIAVTVIADGEPVWAGEPFPLCPPNDVPFTTSLITRILKGRTEHAAA